MGGAGAAGAQVTFSVTAADLVDVSDPAACTPTSGSTFPLGTTTVHCTATDHAGNTGSASFNVTVVGRGAPDGRMYGAGHVDTKRKHHHFVFRVSQLQGRDDGRFEYWVNDPRLCRFDDDYDHERDFDGDHDHNYGRNHRDPPSRFEATSMSDVSFSDAPAFRPERRANGRRSTVETVRFSGTGRWNSQPGYTFEVVAMDKGEPGRHRDTFSLVIRDLRGTVVASVSGDLDGGNIRSTRLIR